MNRWRRPPPPPEPLPRALVHGILWTCAVASVLAVGLVGCGDDERATTEAPVQRGQLTVGNVTRSYRVFVPPTLDRRRAVPLAVVLHGGANTVDDLVKTTQFDRFAATDEFIVAYPEGVGGYWNAGFCCGTAARDGVDDIGFLNALLDRLQADYRIDGSRVFFAGVSNGAIMAYRFACQRAERVTAVGAVAGAMLIEDCQPSRPVSVLEVHGTADTSLPFNGGRVLPRTALATAPVPSTAEIMQRWTQVNGCPPTPKTTVEGPVRTSTWEGCRAGSRVTLVAVEGGGHTWFAAGLGPANGAVDATTVIARFFSDVRS